MSTNTSTINNTDLKNGMQVIIPAGDVISLLSDPTPSTISAGQVLAETSIGPIYFAGNLTSTILLAEDPAAENADTLSGVR